jgi:hypothetical protein
MLPSNTAPTTRTLAIEQRAAGVAADHVVVGVDALKIAVARSSRAARVRASAGSAQTAHAPSRARRARPCKCKRANRRCPPGSDQPTTRPYVTRGLNVASGYCASPNARNRARAMRSCARADRALNLPDMYCARAPRARLLSQAAHEHWISGSSRSAPPLRLAAFPQHCIAVGRIGQSANATSRAASASGLSLPSTRRANASSDRQIFAHLRKPEREVQLSSNAGVTGRSCAQALRPPTPTRASAVARAGVRRLAARDRLRRARDRAPTLNKSERSPARCFQILVANRTSRDTRSPPARSRPQRICDFALCGTRLRRTRCCKSASRAVTRAKPCSIRQSAWRRPAQAFERVFDALQRARRDPRS